MLIWNKEKEKYETVKKRKFSRGDVMNKVEDNIYKFMAGFASVIFGITIIIFMQSC